VGPALPWRWLGRDNVLCRRRPGHLREDPGHSATPGGSRFGRCSQWGPDGRPGNSRCSRASRSGRPGPPVGRGLRAGAGTHRSGTGSGERVATWATAQRSSPSETSFTDGLRVPNERLFELSWEEPFARALATGRPEKARVTYDIAQQRAYCTATAQCCGLGISRTADREWITWRGDEIQAELREPTAPHHALRTGRGLSPGDVSPLKLAPAGQAHADHRREAANSSFAVPASALLPCASM